LTTTHPVGIDAPDSSTSLSQENHLYVRLGTGNPCQSPESAEIVEPKLAIPERVGSEVIVGGCDVTEVVGDHKCVVAAPLVLVVLAVTKLPASSGVWV
jgi:hypothetical protein